MSLLLYTKHVYFNQKGQLTKMRQDKKFYEKVLSIQTVRLYHMTS